MLTPLTQRPLGLTVLDLTRLLGPLKEVLLPDHLPDPLLVDLLTQVLRSDVTLGES